MNLDSDNPFELLGVDPGADAKVLKRAYVRAIKEFRPESHPEEFRKIREAYELAQAFSAKPDNISSSPSASEIPVVDSFDHGDIVSAASSAGPDTSARLRLIEQAIEDDRYEELAGLLDDETLITISREDDDAEFVVSTALRCLAWPEVVAAQKLAARYGFLSTDVGNRFDLLGFDAVHEFYRMANYGGFDMRVLKALRSVLRPSWHGGDEAQFLRDSIPAVDAISMHIALRYPALHSYCCAFLPYPHSRHIPCREILGEDESKDLDARLWAICRRTRGRAIMWAWIPLGLLALVLGGWALLLGFAILGLGFAMVAEKFNFYSTRLRPQLVSVAIDGGYGNVVISNWVSRNSGARAIVGYANMVTDDYSLDILAALHHRCGWEE